MKAMFKKFAFLYLIITSSTINASPFNYFIYESIIEGETIPEGQTPGFQFNVLGAIFLLSPGFNDDPQKANGDNPIEAIIVSGDPSGMNLPPLEYPPNGSFEFSTHMFWYDQKLQLPRQPIDLAYVSFDANQNCFILKPDPNRLTIAERQIINTFSVLGETHVINEGDISVCSNDGGQTIIGTINILGYDAIGHLAQVKYTAKISGQLKQSGEVDL